MTFEEWWDLDIVKGGLCKSRYDKAEAAWEAGIQEGLRRNREWVGLTDEEIGTLTVFDGLHHVETPFLADFVQAIEAKLKEKNA